MSDRNTQRISLILTTKNESHNIATLLDSIANQSLRPAQVVIVDSNSSDNTRQLIKKTAKELDLNLELINQISNRAQARNLAISKTKHQIIAVTDAGCILQKHWLQRIAKPLLQNKADSVAGYYLPIINTCFQKAAAPFVCVYPHRLNPQTFLPSSRSIAFTKQAWIKAGKYPQHLNYCEDLVFASKLKNKTKMVTQANAKVYWHQPTDFFEFFHQLKNYAQGDLEAMYLPHLKKIATVYLRYLIFFFFPPLFPLYLIWPIFKHYPDVKESKCALYLPILQITTDLAVIFGSLQGVISRYFNLNPTNLD